VPRFSVIVPVFKVQGFLRECLDSVLEQSYRDIEVIAVNDCSPDGCGAILDEYAARDPRVQVLHLPENVGLGRARNAGMPLATGDFLFFLDSDDTLTPGALRAMADRLDASGDPDVLVFDYARTYWWGGTRRNVLAHVLTEVDGTFTVAEHPEILDLLMVVWNKVYRREFVHKHAFEFPPGYYEDTPWTFPVLLSAERIATLDRICLNYRQRRQGNILSTTSRKHFDIHDQYERVFAFVDSRPELASWRPYLHRKMAEHCLDILGKPDRLPPSDKAEFFRRTAELFAKHKPAGGAKADAEVRAWKAVTRCTGSGGRRGGVVGSSNAGRCRPVSRRPDASRAACPRCTPAAPSTPTSLCTRPFRIAGSSATRPPSTTRRRRSPRTSGACGSYRTRNRPRWCRRTSSTSSSTPCGTANSPPAPSTSSTTSTGPAPSPSAPAASTSTPTRAPRSSTWRPTCWTSPAPATASTYRRCCAAPTAGTTAWSPTGTRSWCGSGRIRVTSRRCGRGVRAMTCSSAQHRERGRQFGSGSASPPSTPSCCTRRPGASTSGAVTSTGSTWPGSPRISARSTPSSYGCTRPSRPDPRAGWASRICTGAVFWSTRPTNPPWRTSCWRPTRSSPTTRP
jgi:glycosyltransferase involved in cell wall biosynthesis